MKEELIDLWVWGYDNDDMLDGYTIVCWPESQKLFEKKGFRDNSYLIDDEEGLDLYGSSAYVVDNDWLEKEKPFTSY